MDEWMVSILLGVWNGGGVYYCCAAQCSGGGSYPTHPIAVLASTAVMSRTVTCQVLRCDVGECVSVLFVWWGILCPPSPSSWWRVGPSWTVGWHGGWWVAW